jgi:predicted amidophosphoribosyltransferase
VQDRSTEAISGIIISGIAAFFVATFILKQQTGRRVRLKPQERFCAACGMHLQAKANFCGNCGQACPDDQETYKFRL